MRDIHPFLVLSSRNFNDKTSLVHWPAHDHGGIQCRQSLCRCNREGQERGACRQNQLCLMSPAQIIRLAGTPGNGSSSEKIVGFIFCRSLQTAEPDNTGRSIRLNLKSDFEFYAFDYDPNAPPAPILNPRSGNLEFGILNLESAKRHLESLTRRRRLSQRSKRSVSSSSQQRPHVPAKRHEWMVFA